jgi:hypothetical protein
MTEIFKDTKKKNSYYEIISNLIIKENNFCKKRKLNYFVDINKIINQS